MLPVPKKQFEGHIVLQSIEIGFVMSAGFHNWCGMLERVSLSLAFGLCNGDLVRWCQTECRGGPNGRGWFPCQIWERACSSDKLPVAYPLSRGNTLSPFHICISVIVYKFPRRDPLYGGTHANVWASL